jgi:hypothetical protein
MASLSAYYPLPVVAGTTAGTYAEGDHSHELDELDASGIAAGKVLTASGSNTASWEDSTGQVEEAPEDGIIYGRKDADWVDITEPANLQVRRGTAAEVAAITPLEGEPVWATDTKLLYLGDGSTAGGIQVGEFPLDGDVASGPTAGKIRAANSTNGIGAQFGPSQVLGNTRGTGSVDLQMSRISATQVASGLFSAVLGGQNNTASANNSVVLGGIGSTASAARALAFGNAATASGDSSIALNATASGISSIAIGLNGVASQGSAIALQGATSDRANMIAIASPAITNFTGRGQFVQFMLRGYTTNATPTEMIITSATKLTIPQGVALFATIEVSAIQVTTATESAFYVRKFGIQNLGGATNLIGSVTTIGTDHESDVGMDVAITADDNGDFLKVEVTGLASTNLRWMAVVRGVEIAI